VFGNSLLHVQEQSVSRQGPLRGTGFRYYAGVTTSKSPNTGMPKEYLRDSTDLRDVFYRSSLRGLPSHYLPGSVDPAPGEPQVLTRNKRQSDRCTGFALASLIDIQRIADLLTDNKSTGKRSPNDGSTEDRSTEDSSIDDGQAETSAGESHEIGQHARRRQCWHAVRNGRARQRRDQRHRAASLFDSIGHQGLLSQRGLSATFMGR